MDLRKSISQKAAVVDDDIRRSHLELLWGLGIDAQNGLCFAEPSCLLQAGNLDVARAGDHPDGIAVLWPARFDEFDGINDCDDGCLRRACGECL